ncbi:MAG: YceI family protein [Gemmatimonadales bacterium]
MKWNLDTSHSAADFAVRHLMISTVKGRFSKFSGTGETNPDGTLKAVELAIDVASIDTNEPKRDEHLRSADFFDAAVHPNIMFRSTRIDGKGGDVAITGDLTIRGVTKPVTLKGEYTAPVNDPWGNPRAALAVSAKLSRKEFGLTWNQLLEAGGVAVSDEVRISVEVEAVGTKAEVLVAA